MSTKINIYTTSGLFTLTAGDNDVEAVELVKNTYQIIMTRKRARKICRQFGVTIFVNAFQCTICILKYFAKFLFCFHDFSVISFEFYRQFIADKKRELGKFSESKKRQISVLPD